VEPGSPVVLDVRARHGSRPQRVTWCLHAVTDEPDACFFLLHYETAEELRRAVEGSSHGGMADLRLAIDDALLHLQIS
jgi:hypothetical protein